jgi:hypothetical protein
MPYFSLFQIAFLILCSGALLVQRYSVCGYLREHMKGRIQVLENEPTPPVTLRSGPLLRVIGTEFHRSCSQLRALQRRSTDVARSSDVIRPTDIVMRTFDALRSAGSDARFTDCETRSAKANSAEANSAEAHSAMARAIEAPSTETHSLKARSIEAPSTEMRFIEARSTNKVRSI